MSKKTEKYTEYVFSEVSDNKLPYFDSKISAEKMRLIFNSLREKYGIIELIKDYSIYSHNNLELKVYIDGSSFCKRVSMKKSEKNINENICILDIIKNKVSNDIFPCKYSYDSILDIVDIIFNISENISVILRTLYENNKLFDKTKNVKNIGIKKRNIKNIRKSNKYWCTISVITSGENIDEDVVRIIISNIFNTLII